MNQARLTPPGKPRTKLSDIELRRRLRLPPAPETEVLERGKALYEGIRKRGGTEEQATLFGLALMCGLRGEHHPL